MLKPSNMDLLRKYIKAEIEYAIRSNEEDNVGFKLSAVDERNEADKLFSELKNEININRHELLNMIKSS